MEDMELLLTTAALFSGGAASLALDVSKAVLPVSAAQMARMAYELGSSADNNVISNVALLKAAEELTQADDTTRSEAVSGLIHACVTFARDAVNAGHGHDGLMHAAIDLALIGRCFLRVAALGGTEGPTTGQPTLRLEDQPTGAGHVSWWSRWMRKTRASDLEKHLLEESPPTCGNAGAASSSSCQNKPGAQPRQRAPVYVGAIAQREADIVSPTAGGAARLSPNTPGGGVSPREAGQQRSPAPFASSTMPSFPINRTGDDEKMASNQLVIDFGGIPNVEELGLRSSGRIRAQHNADATQMERAKARAERRHSLPGAEKLCEQWLIMQGSALSMSLCLLPYMGRDGLLKKDTYSSEYLWWVNLLFKLWWGSVALGVPCSLSGHWWIERQYARLSAHLGMLGLTVLVGMFSHWMLATEATTVLEIFLFITATISILSFIRCCSKRDS